MITLRPNEKIYLIKRRHRIILMRELFPELLIFSVILILMIFVDFYPFPSWPDWLIKFFPSFLEYNLRYLLLFFLSILLLVLWTILFLVITNFYLDCWIVTNERTIHTELRGLFSRVLSSVNHDRIQDITVDVHGFLPTVFHFGNLIIQTAGELGKFTFQQIPDPYKTKDVIFEAQKEFLNKSKKDGIL